MNKPRPQSIQTLAVLGFCAKQCPHLMKPVGIMSAVNGDDTYLLEQVLHTLVPGRG